MTEERTIAHPHGRTIFVDDAAYHIHKYPGNDGTYFVGAIAECPFDHPEP
jgi:hypothetical protein